MQIYSLIFTTPVYCTHLHMHGVHNTCWNACILSAKNSHALVHVRLCNGAEASLPWKLLQTYLESCASTSQAVVCCLLFPPVLLSQRNPSPDAVCSRSSSRSTLTHDAVTTAVSHKLHLILRIGAGLIQVVDGSYSCLAADLIVYKFIFSSMIFVGFSRVSCLL